MSIGQVIKDKRIEINLKQDAVADMMGVTVQTFSKWENERTEPKASQVAKLAEILELSEGEICRGQRLTSKLDPLEFMQKVASNNALLNDVTVTSILYRCIEDQEKFLAKQDEAIKKLHGFSADDISNLSPEIEREAKFKKEILDDTEDLQRM